jgi:glutathione S-transferase
MAKATLTLTSKNYGAWSLRGWFICKLAGIEFDEHMLESDDPSTRAELLLLAPSFRVPYLTIDGVDVWDTLAIAEYLNELHPESGLLPKDVKARAHCRSICGEMHSGFSNLHAALPMNIRARYDDFKVWKGVQADIDRVSTIWDDCLTTYGGPYLFGATPTMADAMFAPMCSRFRTYGVDLNETLQRYCDLVLSHPLMEEWIAQAHEEPDAIEELENDF